MKIFDLYDLNIYYYRRSDFLQLLVDVAITEKEELAKTGEYSKRCKYL